MSDGLKNISDKLDEMRQDHIRDKYENLCYILWAFTLAMIGITIASPHLANMAVTGVFFVMGWVMLVRARRVRGCQMTVGGRRIWRRLARCFEWVFSTLLMTTITVIVSLEYLSGYSRLVLLIGLFIFFVATLISQFDRAGWFNRTSGG
jgi:hypothetical protein